MEKEFINRLLNPKTQDEAFKELLKQYQKPLYNHIRGIVLIHDDADDVLQNTFVKAFQHLGAFKGESKLFSWLYRIATNEALTHLKKKAKKNHVSIDDMQIEIADNITQGSLFNGDEIQAKLQKAVARLPEKQQLIFKMKYYDELKYEEISEILSTSVGGLKASYHLAVKKIEKFVQQD